MEPAPKKTKKVPNNRISGAATDDRSEKDDEPADAPHVTHYSIAHNQVDGEQTVVFFLLSDGVFGVRWYDKSCTTFNPQTHTFTYVNRHQHRFNICAVIPKSGEEAPTTPLPATCITIPRRLKVKFTALLWWTCYAPDAIKRNDAASRLVLLGRRGGKKRGREEKVSAECLDCHEAADAPPIPPSLVPTGQHCGQRRKLQLEVSASLPARTILEQCDAILRHNATSPKPAEPYTFPPSLFLKCVDVSDRSSPVFTLTSQSALYPKGHYYDSSDDDGEPAAATSAE